MTGLQSGANADGAAASVSFGKPAGGAQASAAKPAAASPAVAGAAAKGKKGAPAMPEPSLISLEADQGPLQGTSQVKVHRQSSNSTYDYNPKQRVYACCAACIHEE